jgi:DNA-binding transcriptional regulator YhcF (GntR family)
MSQSPAEHPVNREEKPRYYKVYNVIYDEDLISTTQARDVYHFLSRCADSDGKCFPSYATIAKRCGIDRRTVSKAIKELQAAKLIKKQNRIAAHGGKTSNHYTILIPMVEKNKPTINQKEKFMELASELGQDAILSLLDEMGILEGSMVHMYNQTIHTTTTGLSTLQQPHLGHHNNQKEDLFKEDSFKREREGASPPLGHHPHEEKNPPAAKEEKPKEKAKEKTEIETKPKTEPEEKNIYGHYKNVLLSQTEYDNLIRDYGQDMVEKYITRISFHQVSKNKFYVNHEATIRRWIYEDEAKAKKESEQDARNNLARSKAATSTAKRNRFANFKGRERDYDEIERLEQELLIRNAKSDKDNENSP